MTVSIQVVSDPSKLIEIEDACNTLINKCSDNPFFLSGFIKQFMEFYQSEGWAPLILVISTNKKIVGIAPLMTKKKFGVQFVKFLHANSFSPDFITDVPYRENCIAHALDFLFKTLRCQFVDLTLSADSPNLRILKQRCKANRICFWTRPEMGHCIIPVKYTWDEFRKLRGRNFRRKFKKIERNLDRAGSWRIICTESGNNRSGAFEKILDVERMSWKKSWRDRRRIKMDQDLAMILKASQYVSKTESDFDYRFWFLELNDQTLAYALVLQYKEAAFIVKTSYDERYKRFYPGIYVNNAAIRELFKERQVRKIDLLTDLPFHRTWIPICLPRVRVMISRKGIIPNLMGFMLMSTYTENARTQTRIILDLLLKRAPVHK